MYSVEHGVMNMFAQCEVAGSVVAKARESRALGRCLGIGRRARPSAHGEVGDGVGSSVFKMFRPAVRTGVGVHRSDQTPEVAPQQYGRGRLIACCRDACRGFANRVGGCICAHPVRMICADKCLAPCVVLITRLVANCNTPYIRRHSLQQIIDTSCGLI